MSKDRELKIIIKADGSVAVTEIKVVAQSTDELEKQLKEARLEMARLEGEFDKVVGKTKSADTEINKLKTDSAALKNENKQLASELQRVQSALTEATTRVRGLEGQLTSATKDVKSFETSWSDLATGVNQALDILGKVKNYAGQGWEIAKQGAQLRAARDSFDDYSRSVGKSSEEILTKLNRASGGTIKDMNLIKSASLSMSLGVTQDASKMANLLEISRNKARLFGITTQQAFEDIVTGIGRASPKILDNLGIRIPAAFEEMTDGMSDTEKVAKLFELTLEEGNNQLRAMGGLSNTTADDLAAFDASVENLKDDFGILLSEAFGPFVGELRKEVIPAIRDAIDVFNELSGSNKKVEQIFKSQGLAGEIATKQSLINDVRQRQAQLDKALNQVFEGGLSRWDRQRFGHNYAGNDNASIEEIKKGIFNEATKLDLELSQLKKELESTRTKMFAESAFKGLEEDLRTEKEAIGILDRLSTEIAEGDKKTQGASGRLRSHQAELKKTTEYYYSLADAMEYTYQANRNLPATLKGTQVGLESAGTAAVSFFDNLKLGNADWFRESLLEIAENAAEVANSFEKIKKSSDFFSKENLKTAQTAVQYLQSGIKEYLQLTVPTQTVSTWDRYGGNVLSAIWQAGSSDSKKAVKDIQEPLSKTIAEAVSAGFANADFSNLELTLGNVLSSILTKSVSQSNPVISSAGAINWGNLGINLAASAVSNVLTRSGRFFGGREEHGKEAIQQASDLKSRMGQTYVDSYVSEITSIYATRAMKDAISNARLGYYGTSTGYTWSDSGDGIFSDRTRTYAMIDNGASTALKKLTDAVKAAETFSENEEAWINLQAAKGYEFGALQAKVKAYEETLTSRYYGQFDLRWSDGTVNEGENLTKLTREIEASLAEMKRELALATAERSTNAAAGFAKYAPWLQNIAVPIDRIPNTVGGTTRPGPDFYSTSVAGLSRDSYYDAFESLQNNLSDRNISSGLIDMVKEAGTSRYELESLKFTDNDAYQEQYLAYVDRQISAYEEILERQEAIFADESKAYEERVAALEAYEQNLEAYHQAKLDKLRLEKAQEEEEKRLMAEQRQSRMESALSLVGELSQRGDKVVILQGGDANLAIAELMEEFADNPEVTAVLKKVQEKNDAKARWG